ncbi:hypothetical protein KCP71_14990 [Salmonella enterica subsp. enterica]|nr:hypothetical protein KCP71_14990 [Salmonella enterica subsp. enterica]
MFLKLCHDTVNRRRCNHYDQRRAKSQSRKALRSSTGAWGRAAIARRVSSTLNYEQRMFGTLADVRMSASASRYFSARHAISRAAAPPHGGVARQRNACRRSEVTILRPRPVPRVAVRSPAAPGCKFRLHSTFSAGCRTFCSPLDTDYEFSAPARLTRRKELCNAGAWRTDTDHFLPTGAEHTRAPSPARR